MFNSKFLASGLLALMPLASVGGAWAQDVAARVSFDVSPRAFREDRNAVRGRIFRRGPALPAVTIRLESTDARVVVPAELSLAEGERQKFFAVRVIDDSIVNDRGSSDGFRAFRIVLREAELAPSFLDLKILDDEPFRAPILSPVKLERFEALGDSKNVARLVFSGPVSFNPSNAYGVPGYGLGINGLMARVARLQVINRQVLLITFDRDFAPGDTITVAAYNLTDARGLPLGDQIRVAKVPLGPPFSIEVSKSKFREDAGPNASRVTIRLAYAADKPLTFQLLVNELKTLPKRISAPASVTIPAGARAVSFSVAAIDNDMVDGDIINFLTVVAPYPTPPTSPLVRLDIVDDERAPVSGVRILSATRQGQGVVRLRFSGSIRNPFNIGPSEDNFRVRIGARSFRPFGNISVDATGTIADVLTGVSLPDDQEVTITISGLRDASLAVIPTTSITLPPVPSVPSA